MIKIRKADFTTMILLMLIILADFTMAECQSLQKYIEIGLENNPTLKAKYKEFEASMLQAKQVGNLSDPSLSIGYFLQPVETRVGPMQARVSLSQKFPWFGTLKKEKAVAAMYAESKYMEFLQVRNQLIAEIKKAYFPIYEAKSHIALLKDDLQILNTYKSLVTTSFSGGKGTLSDVINIDLQQEETTVSIELLDMKLASLMSKFNLLINQKDDDVITQKFTLEESIESVFLMDSVENNPYLKALEKRILALQAEETLAVKNSYPQIGIGVDYTFVGEKTDSNINENGKNSLMPMVSMSLPVFRGKYKAEIKEKRINKEQLEFEKQAYINSVLSDYQEIRFELGRSVRLNELYTSQIRKTNEIIELLYTAYSNSGKDFDEVLKAQQQLLKYRMEKNTIIKKYHTALADLELLTANGF